MYENDYLKHYGVVGMKWGVRRARKANRKVDKSFKKWKEESAKKENAINLGKQNNLNRMAYNANRKDENLKTAYKQSNKAYKKALRSNTTYRKGSIREEVGKDASRKYLSAAKKVKKQLDADPSNKALKKQYKDLSDRHDVERAKARKAQRVAANRSRRKAAVKRSMTMTVKAAATTAIVSTGIYATNKYLNSHNVTLNGKRVQFNTQNINDVANMAKKVKNFMDYMY